MLVDYRAAAEDERRREGEAREEASRTFHRGMHPVMRRSRCCIAPPDGKRGCGTGDLRDNGGSDDDIRRHGPGGGARCDPDRLIKNT